MRSVRPVSQKSTIASRSILFGCVSLALIDTVLATATPGYNVIGETSSQLMNPGQPYSTVARVTLALYAVLLIPFGTMLRSGLSESQLVRPLIMSGLWTHIASALITAAALNDSDGMLVGNLSNNEVHDLSAVIMFAAIVPVIAGAAMAQRTMAKVNLSSDSFNATSDTPVAFLSRRLTQLSPLTWLTLAIVLVSGTLFTLEMKTEWNGVLERVTIAAFLTWLSAFALLQKADNTGDVVPSSLRAE